MSSKKDDKKKDNLPVKRELKKPVEAIHVASSMGLVQRKLMNTLMFYALPDIARSEVTQYTCSIAKLAKDIRFDSNNRSHLKKEIRSLIEKVIEWNLLDNGQEVWRASTMLADAEIRGGELSYGFSSTLRRMLIDSKAFAMLNLEIQNQFDSLYSYNLYENTVRFKRIGHTGPIEIEKLKKLLGVSNADDACYSEFKYFNKLVLKKAIDEVNRVSDIILTPKLFRTNRYVVAIDFLIEIKPSSGTDDGDTFISADNDKVELLKRLLDLGINSKDAHGYFDLFDIERIAGNLSIVEERVESDPERIKNVPAYFKKAIEEDYRTTVPKAVVEAEKKRKENQSALDKQKQLEKQQADVAGMKHKNAMSYYESQPASMKNKLESDFVAFLESSENEMVMGSYRKKGLLGSKMVSSLFTKWLSDLLED